MPRRYDSQQLRAYEWEQDVLSAYDRRRWPLLNQRRATRIIENMIADGREAMSLSPVEPRLEIVFPRHGPSNRLDAYYEAVEKKKVRTGEHRFRFPVWARNECFIAHEVAHYLDAIDDPGNTRQWHGPHWLGWYVALLLSTGQVEEWRIERSLKRYRLKYVTKCLEPTP